MQVQVCLSKHTDKYAEKVKVNIEKKKEQHKKEELGKGEMCVRTSTKTRRRCERKR